MSPPSLPAGTGGADVRHMSDGDLFALVPDDLDWRDVEKKTTPAHTAQRVKSNSPLLYEQCRRLLESGVEILVIAECMKVGVNTLYAIIDAELGGLEQYQKGLAGRMSKVVNLGVARMAQLIPGARSLAEVSMATGVMFDKLQLLQGAPSVIVEQRVTVQAERLESLNELAAQVREKLARARVVESEEPPALTEGTGGLEALPLTQPEKHET